jgi:hypothetical protein
MMAKKRNNMGLSLVRSKWFLLGAALLIAVFIIVGLRIFASDGVGGTGADATYLDWQAGKVGIVTQKEADLYRDSFYSYNDEVYMINTNPVFMSRNLSAGSSGEDVWALKAALNTLAPKDPSDPYYFTPLALNSNFDSSTQKVVTLFQRFYGLPQNGVFDAPLNEKIMTSLTNWSTE